MSGVIKGVGLSYKENKYTEPFDDNSSVTAVEFGYKEKKYTEPFDDNSSVVLVSFNVKSPPAYSQIILTEYIF